MSLRLGLSGCIAGGLGGVVLVGLVFALDIAHLRSLAMAATTPPSLGDWLTVPLAFAAAGLAIAWTTGRDDT